ncbi:MAG: DoxX family protein [Acidimicrobiia bacterium]
MNIALWIAQVVLALSFVAAGGIKVSQPKEKLEASMGWVEDFSLGFVRFVGAVELLGGLGLILPGITDIAPILTPLAASGLAVDQTAAAVVHLRRREPRFIFGNVVLFAVAVLIAWGRFGDYPL